MTNELSNALTKVQDATKAHISFKPTITQQRKDPKLEETLLDGDFLIRYDVKRSVTADDIQQAEESTYLYLEIEKFLSLEFLYLEKENCYTFLEKMALENGGLARRIYDDSDAALQLQDFYQEISTPILKEIEIKYPDSAALEITQNNFKLLFDGSEIVVAGKISNEIDVFPVEISANTLSNALILKERANVTEKEQVFQDEQYIFGNFTERLWAYLTIQQRLQKLALATGEQKKNLEAQVLELSLKFRLVTPFTSMVVTKPESQEVANKPTEADNENVGRLGIGSTSGVLNYPHFIIPLPGGNDLVCLHVSGQSQTPINLLSDPAKGIGITGKLGENGQFVHFEVAYQQPDVQITITKEGVVLNHTSNATMFPWTTTATVTIQG
ncbi:hypothetical protein lerEdw1_020682 [Lerista edwardsae]|nr:hypothetical protein lerEdw1_020682 [Lerista edwardsae]